MRNIALRATFVTALASAGAFAACSHNKSTDTNPMPTQSTMLTDAGVSDGMMASPRMPGDAQAMANAPALEIADVEPMAGDAGINPTHMPGNGAGSGSAGSGSRPTTPRPGPIATPNNPSSPGAPTTPVPAPAPGTPTPGGPTPPPPPVSH